MEFKTIDNMNFKQNALIRIHQERRDKARKVKEKFVDSGDYDKTIDNLHKKMEPSIKPGDLPF